MDWRNVCGFDQERNELSMGIVLSLLSLVNLCVSSCNGTQEISISHGNLVIIELLVSARVWWVKNTKIKEKKHKYRNLENIEDRHCKKIEEEERENNHQ